MRAVGQGPAPASPRPWQQAGARAGGLQVWALWVAGLALFDPHQAQAMCPGLQSLPLRKFWRKNFKVKGVHCLVFLVGCACSRPGFFLFMFLFVTFLSLFLLCPQRKPPSREVPPSLPTCSHTAVCARLLPLESGSVPSHTHATQMPCASLSAFLLFCVHILFFNTDRVYFSTTSKEK